MNKESIRDFFDGLAFSWDKDLVRNEDVIKMILDNAKVSCGKDVLDVACGTGVLIDDYLNRGVHKVTAIDLSSEMIRVAKNKFNDDRVDFVCGDVLGFDDGHKYDSIMVYNAFPHFCDGDLLVRHLSSLLKDNGTLSIAHGMSRDRINMHHSGVASEVSNTLMSIEELASIFSKYLTVEKAISNDLMYQVVGVLKKD